MTHWPKGIVYCAHAEHAYDLQTKFEKLNSDRNDVLSIPSYAVERDRPMGDATGTRKDRESTIKPMSLLEMAMKKECKSIRDGFLIGTIYRQSQLDIGWTEDLCARLDEIAAEDHSCMATAAGPSTTRKHVGSRA